MLIFFTLIAVAAFCFAVFAFDGFHRWLLTEHMARTSAARQLCAMAALAAAGIHPHDMYGAKRKAVAQGSLPLLSALADAEAENNRPGHVSTTSQSVLGIEADLLETSESTLMSLVTLNTWDQPKLEHMTRSLGEYHRTMTKMLAKAQQPRCVCKDCSTCRSQASAMTDAQFAATTKRVADRLTALDNFLTVLYHAGCCGTVVTRARAPMPTAAESHSCTEAPK